MLDFFDYQMPDNQARDLKYQINQYLSEILIVTLGPKWVEGGGIVEVKEEFITSGNLCSASRSSPCKALRKSCRSIGFEGRKRATQYLQLTRRGLTARDPRTLSTTK